MNNQKAKHKNNKGITLVALIITIIVLLILAVVAIGAIKNDGIIDYAKNAKRDYMAEADRENQLLQNALAYINDNVPGQENSGNGDGAEQEPGDDGTDVQPEPTVAVSGDSNQDNKLGEGETWTLALKDAQGNAITGVTYTSENNNIATVNSSTGVVTAISNGTARITATYTVNGETKSKTHDIIGAMDVLEATGDTNNNGKLNYGETWTLALKDAEGNAISGVSYSSSDTSIATVNSSTGVIEGVSHGSTTITATYTENGETKTKTYDMNVVENIQQISFWLESSYLNVGDTTRVIVTTSPTTNPKGTFEYRSSNNSVATIDNNGNVKGISSGSFEITVYYYPPEGSDGYQIKESSPGYLVGGGGFIEPEDPFDEL